MMIWVFVLASFVGVCAFAYYYPEIIRRVLGLFGVRRGDAETLYERHFMKFFILMMVFVFAYLVWMIRIVFFTFN